MDKKSSRIRIESWDLAAHKNNYNSCLPFSLHKYFILKSLTEISLELWHLQFDRHSVDGSVLPPSEHAEVPL